MVLGMFNCQIDEIEKIKVVFGVCCVGVFDVMLVYMLCEVVIVVMVVVCDVDVDLIVIVGGGLIIDGVKVVQICLVNYVDIVDGIDCICVYQGVVFEMKVLIVWQVSVLIMIVGGEFSVIVGVIDCNIYVKQMLWYLFCVLCVIIFDFVIIVYML